MRTESLNIGGMTCGGCVNAVTRALNAVAGVKDVAVSLKPGAAKIEFDEQIATPTHLRDAVRQAGYEVDVAERKQPAKSGCCG